MKISIFDLENPYLQLQIASVNDLGIRIGKIKDKRKKFKVKTRKGAWVKGLKCLRVLVEGNEIKNLKGRRDLTSNKKPVTNNKIKDKSKK